MAQIGDYQGLCAEYEEDIAGQKKEIERLKKEKEWLTERASHDVYSYMYPTIEERKKYIIEEMQQALKEGE